MIKLFPPELDGEILYDLAKWQNEVDRASNYALQVEAAKKMFKQKNTKRNHTFNQIKIALSSMCSGARRCVYCEDSVADEVEHISPKDLYPDRVFSWDNYIYACGPCNGPKNNRYSIIKDGDDLELVDITRKARDPVNPPIDGIHALINPRIDNPADYFDLDLIDTFTLFPKENLDQESELKANFTLDILDLNRDVLLLARANAFGSYKARLVEYRDKVRNNAQSDELFQLKAGFKMMPHPTVFAEIKRFSEYNNELKKLFEDIPEVLTW